MRGVFWNCNGFKDPKKHRFVSDLCREQNLSFIAVSEMDQKGFHDSVFWNLCGVKFSFGTAKNLGEGRGHFVRN
jgi:hypothetical protein